MKSSGIQMVNKSKMQLKKYKTKTDLTEKDLEVQENLNLSRLKLLRPKHIWSNENRPEHNLIDLMHWVRAKFTNNSDKYKCIINNKIVMDGSFMEFCEQFGVKITTEYLDSIASWRSDYDSEHFIAQGVFKITHNNLEFIHAALFHKGNQNEDEVSFFIIVSEEQFHKYVEFRNMYDRWLISRDREHLEIHVVGGEGYPYARDMGWDDLFLPQPLKDDIRNSIEGWLSAKDIYLKSNIPWKRGILLYGMPGCHTAGTEILCFDGLMRKVEDIKVGDLLMGPDSKPREVLKLVRGKEEMFKITPKKGNPFVVNKNHILHLVHSGQSGGPPALDVSVKDYLNCSQIFKDRNKLKYSNAIVFKNEQDPLVDPYFLGLWLGDGSISAPHIPQQYLLASIDKRLQLLAGIIDSDGLLAASKNNSSSKIYFEVSQKSEKLAKQIVFLAKSLGLGATIKKKNFSGIYYRVNIFGEINKIPTKILRKQPTKGNPNKDPLRTGISKIESVGVGDYYGFTLDGDHLYLTGDFMIHHNCGKSSTIKTIISNYDFKPVTVLTSHQTTDDSITEAFEYAQSQEPGLLYIEDLDSLLGHTVSYSHFLNLMDGVSTRNGIVVIATANDISRLKESVTDRPSRFDRKWEIPPPNRQMTLKYLRFWFGKGFKLDKIVDHSVMHKFSYAYLKEMYLTSIFHALAAGREKAILEDVEKAVEQLLYDKKQATEDFFELSGEGSAGII